MPPTRMLVAHRHSNCAHCGCVLCFSLFRNMSHFVSRYNIQGYAVNTEMNGKHILLGSTYMVQRDHGFLLRWLGHFNTAAARSGCDWSSSLSSSASAHPIISEALPSCCYGVIFTSNAELQSTGFSENSVFKDIKVKRVRDHVPRGFTTQGRKGGHVQNPREKNNCEEQNEKFRFDVWFSSWVSISFLTKSVPMHKAYFTSQGFFHRIVFYRIVSALVLAFRVGFLSWKMTPGSGATTAYSPLTRSLGWSQ